MQANKEYEDTIRRYTPSSPDMEIISDESGFPVGEAPKIKRTDNREGDNGEPMKTKD